MRESLRRAIEGGLPVYAECGGLMYLARSLSWHGHAWDMVGALPVDVVMHGKPVGKGYVNLAETGDHPWGSGEGTVIRAHEFHYSTLAHADPALRYAYRVVAGRGDRGRARRHRPPQRAGILCAPAQRRRQRLGPAVPSPRGASEGGARRRGGAPSPEHIESEKRR